MAGRPATAPASDGGLATPPGPIAAGKVELRNDLLRPGSSSSPTAVGTEPMRVSDRLSDIADEVMERGRVGVVKAEFYYRHGRRLAGL